MDIASSRRMAALGGQAGAMERVAAIDTAADHLFRLVEYGEEASRRATQATWASFREIIERQAAGGLCEEEILICVGRMQLATMSILNARTRKRIEALRAEVIAAGGTLPEASQ